MLVSPSFGCSYRAACLPRVMTVLGICNQQTSKTKSENWGESESRYRRRNERAGRRIEEKTATPSSSPFHLRSLLTTEHRSGRHGNFFQGLLLRSLMCGWFFVPKNAAKWRGETKNTNRKLRFSLSPDKKRCREKVFSSLLLPRSVLVWQGNRGLLVSISCCLLIPYPPWGKSRHGKKDEGLAEESGRSFPWLLVTGWSRREGFLLHFSRLPRRKNLQVSGTDVCT